MKMMKIIIVDGAYSFQVRGRTIECPWENEINP